MVDRKRARHRLSPLRPLRLQFGQRSARLAFDLLLEPSDDLLYLGAETDLLT